MDLPSSMADMMWVGHDYCIGYAPEVEEWLTSNLGEDGDGRWVSGYWSTHFKDTVYLKFQSDEDAVAFKLMFADQFK